MQRCCRASSVAFAARWWYSTNSKLRRADPKLPQVGKWLCVGQRGQPLSKRSKTQSFSFRITEKMSRKRDKDFSDGFDTSVLTMIVTFQLVWHKKAADWLFLHKRSTALAPKQNVATDWTEGIAD
jgi:hypothetical protein